MDALIVTENEAASTIADRICTDSGYQEYKIEKGVFYCATYGLEPELLRLGTQADLLNK